MLRFLSLVVIFLTSLTIYGQEVHTHALFSINSKFENFEDIQSNSGQIDKIIKQSQKSFGVEAEVISNTSSLDFLTKLRALSQREYTRTEQVLIYISGKIHYDSLFNMRYLLFNASSEEDFSSMISFQELLVMLGNIPSYHTLLLMDCGPIWDFDKTIENTAYLGITTLDGYAHDDVANRLNYRTQKYIYLNSTSGEDKQKWHESILDFLGDDSRQEEIAGIKDFLRHLQEQGMSDRIHIGPFMMDEPASEFLFQYRK